ncbi:MAG: VIT1/CCC1 transporter family protein [Candidatus Algichlamydia australiensis]|nr:VIT1/CCC1 transporter family protein [Chlamydiales bacterium]
MCNHFEGKSAAEHLKAARLKGAHASAEIHGTEAPGSFVAFCDSAKETAVYLLLFSAILPQLGGIPPYFFPLFILALLVWKIGRSGLLAYSRLDRLHRLIEEERFEIEHHREQEREELTEMYAAKGLKGDLLKKVIDVLMADDNRLLAIMLEEELGLTFESFDHPLIQALGAGLGILLAGGIALGALFLPYGLPIASFLIVAASSALMARRRKNEVIPSTVWNLSLIALTYGVAYFVTHLFAGGA